MFWWGRPTTTSTPPEGAKFINMTHTEQLLDTCRQKLIQVRSTLDGKTPPPDTNAARVFNRSTLALAYLDSRLKAVDAILAPRQQLQNFANQLDSLERALRGGLQNASQWQILDNAIDGTVAAVAVLPQTPPELAPEQYGAALRDFIAARDEAVKQAEARAAKMEEKARVLEGAVNNATAKAAGIENRLNAETARLDKLVSDAQARFSTLEQDLSTSSRRAEAERDKNAKDAEARRDKAAADAEAKRAADAKAAFDGLLAATKQAVDEQQKSSGAHAKEIEMRLEEAKKIVGLIANTGMAGHYQKTAGVEWWSMWVLRVAAVTFFFLAAAAVARLISLVHAQQVDWELMVFRFALVAVALAPAFYLARGSERHMRREAYYRRIELELAAFRPFIESLPDEKKKEIIEKKADEFFGREPPPEQDEHQLLRETWFRGDQLVKLVTRVLAAWRGK